MKDNIKEITSEGHNIKVKTKNGYQSNAKIPYFHL